MGTIGEIKLNEIEIEWKIPNFSTFSNENSVSYTSPTFSYNNETWYLRIFPNGYDKISTGYISLLLCKKLSASSINVKYTLGLKTVGGQKDSEKHLQHTFDAILNRWGYFKHLLRSRLFEKEVELLPGNVLTVFCSMEGPTSFATRIKGASSEKCPLCEKNVDADNLKTHQRKDKLIKCPDCSAVFTLQNWCDHECQSQETSCEPINELTSNKLSDDFKALMLSGDHSDTVVKVKTEEFHLHRSILAARNSHFDKMLKSDMKEKSTGIITIQDCEPNIFRSFTHFLYSAKVDSLSPENVCQLYTVADKYQEDQLKKECLNFMLNTIPLDNFCEYFTLAFTHNEKELLKKCADFFTTKGKEIVCSVKWQTLLKEYPIQANELLIKALNYLIK